MSTSEQEPGRESDPGDEPEADARAERGADAELGPEAAGRSAPAAGSGAGRGTAAGPTDGPTDGALHGATDGGADAQASVSLTRWVLGAFGLLLIGIGGWHLAARPDPYDVLLWLGGALVLHDVLIAPLVLAIGLLVAAVPARPVVRGALITAGSLVLITLPLLLRPGAPPNPSALPLPYARNLLLVLAVTALAGIAAAWLSRRRRGGPRLRDGARRADDPPRGVRRDP